MMVHPRGARFDCSPAAGPGAGIAEVLATPERKTALGAKDDCNRKHDQCRQAGWKTRTEGPRRYTLLSRTGCSESSRPLLVALEVSGCTGARSGALNMGCD